MAEKRAAETEAVNVAKKARQPKRKVALQIGYCGTGYHGMQLNPPHKTIEGDLFEALVKAGAVSEDNADDPKKSSFLRAARTDKGVHAAGNVVSLKMIIEDPEIVAKVNNHLPEQIRVWGFTRTNRAFECRKVCSSRIYEYVLPTYTLMAPSPFSQLGKILRTQTQRLGGDSALDTECNNFWNAVETEFNSRPNEVRTGEAQTTEASSTEASSAHSSKEAKDSDTTEAQDSKAAKNAKAAEEEETEEARYLRKLENKARRSYRIIPERLALFREALKTYEGVHNFHNFTVGKHFNDPSATRIMRSLTVSDPFVINGTEWVSVKIHGQSFMLHQIRKMIALAVLAVRTNSPAEKVSGLYSERKIPIPKAPALGLLLERPMYDAYNKKLKQFGHETISFDQYEGQIDAFKHKFVYDRIYTQEAQENEFHAFFGYMDTYLLQGILNYLLDVEAAPIEKAEDAHDSESDNDANNEEAEG